VLIEEEMDEKEVAEELLPVTVQLAYVAAASNNSERAIELLTCVRPAL
jgi:hypothetical protein